MAESKKEAKKPRKPGRPSFRPSIEDRVTVERMKYCGEAEDTIARALKISTPTLRQHFKDELKDGHASRRQQVIELMFEAAEDGNAAAIRRLEEIGQLAGAAQRVSERGRRADGEETPEKLGKKEEASRAAQEVAVGRFETPPAPKLVVNNQ